MVRQIYWRAIAVSGVVALFLGAAWGWHKHLLDVEFEKRGLERSVSSYIAAVKRADVEAVQVFLKDGFSPNERYGRAEEPVLLAAAKGNHWEIVRILVQAGADVTASSVSGHQAIHVAASYGLAGMVQGLLDLGADVNATGKPTTEGGAFVPIYEATLVGSRFSSLADANARAETVKVLLRGGAHVNEYFPGANRRGTGPLHNAVFTVGLEETVRFLIEHGAELEHEDDSGTTPLMIAAYVGNNKSLDVLLAAGAQPNHRTSRGTALLLAVQNGQFSAARRLLAEGADPRLSDASGKNAFDFATTSDVIRLLRNHK
jgi:ankyrin repeat protein